MHLGLHLGLGKRGGGGGSAPVYQSDFATTDGFTAHAGSIAVSGGQLQTTKTDALDAQSVRYIDLGGPGKNIELVLDMAAVPQGYVRIGTAVGLADIRYTYFNVGAAIYTYNNTIAANGFWLSIDSASGTTLTNSVTVTIV